MATPPTDQPRTLGAGALYRTLWRWHFYAGLFVMPFVVVLALSGSVYLFKPQIERWEERAFTGLAAPARMTPSRHVEAALAAFPGAHFHSYRVPVRATDAALVHVAMADGRMRDVFVAPDGSVLGSRDAATRIVEVARRLHSELLVGPRVGWLVELAACWAIVMVITGLCLWWPRGRGMAGVLWPRRSSLLRDLHAVAGFWVSSFALVLLLTGLPWTDVWGNAFRALRTEMGWVSSTPQWATGDTAPPGSPEHGSHDHTQMHAGHSAEYELQHLDALVARAAAEQVEPPALVLAPGAMRFGFAAPDWVLTSGTQNRPRGITIRYSVRDGAELQRETFAQQHPIDRVVGYGLAWHEGALFGAANQLVGVLTALALVTMSVTGFLMWRKRRPAGRLGAPSFPVRRAPPLLVTGVIVTLALLLPLLAVSLLVLWLIDAIVPRVSPAAAAWLGMRT